jgi:NADH:ubiquinone oxidoreductase subunit F (NADH-binding)
MMQASKKIPFDDPNVLNGVRALYVVSNLIIAGIYLYTKMQIDKKRGMSRHFEAGGILYADLRQQT